MPANKYSIRVYSTESLDCISPGYLFGEDIGFHCRMSKCSLAKETIFDGLFIPNHSIINDCVDIISGKRKSLYHCILEKRNKGIGVALIMETHPYAKKGEEYLLQIFVKPRYRRKGVAQYLIKNALLFAVKNNIKLLTCPKDEAGEKLFTKFKKLKVELIR